jgi:hypothetical protein
VTQTSSAPLERFELERSGRWLFLAAPWLFLALALFSAALPVLPGDRPRNEPFLLAFSIVACLGFAVGAWYSWKIVRQLPEAAISVDEQGLWPSIKNRHDAMVPWNSIVRLRERALLQRIDALDATGRTVARLEYQLKNFDRLRAIVLQRASLRNSARLASSPDAYQRPGWHHLLSIGSMLGFTLLGVYVGQTDPVLGYGSMTFIVGLIAWEYWTLPFHLRITPDALEIRLPGRRRLVPREHIAKVEIQDELINHTKQPAVMLQLVSGAKPVKLKGLGVQAVELHQALQAWHRGTA